MRPVRLDVTPSTALSVCTDCGARHLRGTRHAALLAAADHYDLAPAHNRKAAGQLRDRAAGLSPANKTPAGRPGPRGPGTTPS